MRNFLLIISGIACAMLLTSCFSTDWNFSMGDRANNQSSSSCFWYSAGIEKTSGAPENSTQDTYVRYWVAHFSLPVGAEIVLEGSFPSARAASLTSYKDGLEHHALKDEDIDPLAGSVNPFRALAANQSTEQGADSTVYRVHLAASPITNATNTLYVEPGVDDQVVIIYRVVLADENDSGGDIVPPAVKVDGFSGQDACDVLQAELKEPAEKAISANSYSVLRTLPSPASNPPYFRAAFNPEVNLLCAFNQNSENCRVGDRPPRSEGLYATSHNQYAYTHLDRSIEPVVAIFGRLPKTPSNTPKGTPLDMRYWSLCQSEFFSMAVVDCLHDGQLHLDEEDYYVIVTSLSDDRPANATDACGVNYLAWPQNGDGFGVAAPLGEDDPKRGFLVLRNLMTSPDFPYAIYHTELQGEEADVMGEYLPQARYLERGEFESLVGCDGMPYPALMSLP